MNQKTKKLAATPNNDIIAEVYEITPAIAAEWLKSNNGNRPLTKKNVQFLARELREGRWQVNGEAIKFDKNGRLSDGQHRLHACIAANLPFNSMVVMGVEPETFATMDTGRNRSAGDVLSFEGITSAHTLAAGIRAAMFLEGVLPSFKEKVSNEEIVDWYRKNPEIAQYVNAPKIIRQLSGAYVYVGMRYIVSQRHPVLAAQFFEQFESGMVSSEKSPIKLLRDRLVIAKGGKAKLSPTEQLAHAVKAWNYFISGRTAVTLRWRNEEDFPRLK